MTRIEKILVRDILIKWPDKTEKDAVKWLYSLSYAFDNLSPFSFHEKFGGKRFKKKLRGL